LMEEEERGFWSRLLGIDRQVPRPAPAG